MCNISYKSKKIKLFAMDCDGVLTDGGMYYSINGEFLKKFNTKDGMGIKLLRDKGIEPMIITGENSMITKMRAEKLEIKHIYLNINNKKQLMDNFTIKYNYSYEEVAYIGDDINDIELLKSAGLSFAVNDAMNSVIDVVDIVTTKKGGEGAVREAIDILLSYYNN